MLSTYTATVGAVKLVSLTDGHFDPVPTTVFPDSSIETWRDEYADLMVDSDHTRFRFGSVAIYSAGKTVIVDTGAGPDGSLIDEMASKGIDRDTVDYVLITHLHADHTGWTMMEGKPTFPNARYLIPRVGYDYWTQPDVLARTPSIEAHVRPLERLGVIDLVDGDHSITSELTTMSTPGHTPATPHSRSAPAGNEDSFSGMSRTAQHKRTTPIGARHLTSTAIFRGRLVTACWMTLNLNEY